MLTDVTSSLKKLLLLLLFFCLTGCVPIDDQPLSAVGQRLLQDIERTADVTPSLSTVTTVPHMAGCNKFTAHQNAVTVEGEIFLKSGNGILPEQCKAACVAQTAFFCTAAVMRRHGACYLTGYKPKGHFMSTHFYRMCKGSHDCFIPLSGFTVGGSKEIEIPQEYQFTGGKEIYCMGVCDRQDSCVGFDMIERSTNCLLTDMSTLPTYAFDTYIRTC